MVRQKGFNIETIYRKNKLISVSLAAPLKTCCSTVNKIFSVILLMFTGEMQCKTARERGVLILYFHHQQLSDTLYTKSIHQQYFSLFSLVEVANIKSS
mgnify:CR=1 FL=1